MLLCFCPNPCVERVLTLDEFRVGQTQRISSHRVRETVGGKALNAARVAQHCGAQVLATGWFGTNRRAWFADEIQRDGVEFSALETAQETRASTLILSENAPPTEIVEGGHALTIEDGTRMLARLEELLPQAQMLLIGGSYPPGERAISAHASVVCGMAKRLGVPVFYDGHGLAWEMALRSAAPPWAIKPNLREASEFWRREVSGESEERRAIAGWLKLGIEVVLLSCGKRGAWLGTREQTVFLNAPRVETISAVGSGDSMSGAFACKYLQRAHLPARERIFEAARWGVAAGSANAAQRLSAQISVDEIEALLPQVHVGASVLSLSVR